MQRLRIIGSLGAVTGQFILLFHSTTVGLFILVVCSVISLPYFLRNRYYDIALTIFFGTVINLLGIVRSLGR